MRVFCMEEQSIMLPAAHSDTTKAYVSHLFEMYNTPPWTDNLFTRVLLTELL